MIAMTLFETDFAKKSGYFLLVTLLAVGLTSCDLTEGYDRDPNASTEANGPNLLNSAQVASILYQDGNHARVTSFFTEQLNGAQRQYAGQDRPGYGVTASDVDNLWITGYADTIGDLQVVKEKANESGDGILLGIAQATQALTFGTKTSLHGDIPASEAVQGSDNLNPKFDSQLQVYDQFVIGQLESAISNLNQGTVTGNIGANDVFFGGNPASWIEASNTLMARYMLHLAHVDQGPASDYSFQDVYDTAQNGISSRSGNLIAPHGLTNEVNANPFWQFRADRGDDLDAAGSYAARLLDPDAPEYRGNSKSPDSLRFSYYFFDNDGSYDMAGNARTNSDREEGDFFYSKNQDFPIATYAENELIKAEAALHASGQSFSDALTALNNARGAIEDQFGGSFDDYVAADFQSGGIANPGGLSQEQALLKEILEEKYLILTSNIEAFADLRRTNNYAEVTDPSGSVLEFNGSGDAPERFPYAQSEVTGNENTPDPIPGLFQPTTVFGASYPTP